MTNTKTVVPHKLRIAAFGLNGAGAAQSQSIGSSDLTLVTFSGSNNTARTTQPTRHNLLTVSFQQKRMTNPGQTSRRHSGRLQAIQAQPVRPEPSASEDVQALLAKVRSVRQSFTLSPTTNITLPRSTPQTMRSIRREKTGAWRVPVRLSP